MEKIIKGLGYLIIIIGAAMIIYPALVNFILKSNEDFFGAIITLPPVITFFWFCQQTYELTENKKTIANLRAHIKHIK